MTNSGPLISHHEHIVWGVPLLGEQDPDEPLREHRSSGDHSFTITFDAYYEAVSQTVARRDRLDTVIEDLAAISSFTPMVNRLVCLRGVSALTGLALAVEIGDWHRFLRGTGAVGILLRAVSQPGRDHQDRQLPCPSAAG